MGSGQVTGKTILRYFINSDPVPVIAEKFLSSRANVKNGDCMNASYTG